VLHLGDFSILLPTPSHLNLRGGTTFTTVPRQDVVQEGRSLKTATRRQFNQLQRFAKQPRILGVVEKLLARGIEMAVKVDNCQPNSIVDCNKVT